MQGASALTESMGPDSIVVRGVLWALFNGQVFSPERDLITQGAYMRMRGAKKWPWSVDASFRYMHDLTAEDIRGCYESLGQFGVRSFFRSCRCCLYSKAFTSHLDAKDYRAKCSCCSPERGDEHLAAVT